MTNDATIFAPTTAQGRAGIAVFRISGMGARQAIEKLCRPKDLPAPRMAKLCKIHHPETGEVIDHALILWFPAPHSFTGEDVVEFHTHGGRAVMQAMAGVLAALPSFRLAEPGEFSRRAFEHGKLDLTEAEAIADLVDAETETQRRQAVRQLEGALGKLYEDWRAKLAHVLAYLEAAIDFSDEDLPKDTAEKQIAALRNLIVEIDTHLGDRHRGERLREGFSIAILGPPNAGKSSLLNALARREAAIVSSTAGTTRDVIEVHLDLGGYAVMLSDTAGLRESGDAIESEGVRRALARAGQADLKVIVFDGEAWPEMDEAARRLIDEDTMVVVNKKDVMKSHQISAHSTEGNLPQSTEVASFASLLAASPLFLSAETGEGLPMLLEGLVGMIDLRFSDGGTVPLTRARHRAALEECATHLKRALTARETELSAEDVRLAMRALGRITGRVDVEDLLDIIFRDFCIGK